MEIEYYRINPTGNITLIAETPVPREFQSTVASKLMALDPGAEQVGFIEQASDSSAEFRLQMMGGEFCGNASISAAALAVSRRSPDIGGKTTVILEVSGTQKPLAINIEYKGENTYSGTLSMPLPESSFECRLVFGGETYTLPLIRMPGICHAIVKGSLSPQLAEKAVAEWCRQLDAEALGLMFYNASRGLLRPFVYVASTGSAVWESSCASGSCAVAAYESLACGEALALSLKQPGGTLCVKSVCARGTLLGLNLTGSAEIMGKYSTVIDT